MKLTRSLSIDRQLLSITGTPANRSEYRNPIITMLARICIGINSLYLPARSIQPGWARKRQLGTSYQWPADGAQREEHLPATGN